MSQVPWRAELAASFTRVEDLLQFLELPTQALLQSSLEAASHFPFRVTRSYAERMRKGDEADPLLRQVLPVAEELREQPGFSADPVGDLAAVAATGVLQKYHGRALLVTTGACAINCRYCFRREFPYGEEQMSRQHEAAALDYLAAEPSVAEVILSGGDPLVLSDERLGALIGKIAALGHVRRLRIHSRLPVVLPSRVTESFLSLFTRTRLRSVLVIHANHAREIDGSVSAALRALGAAGVTLLNQSVLLKGVNDSVEDLAGLSEALFASGVSPYYLHALDKARGTAHFDLPLSEAMRLHEGLRRKLPGYLVPKLVREEPGEPYKVLL
ncbi:MAG: epmB [Proteobacteria bacterium]|nr:epmB [Pseudomonadota bacterium]